MTRSSMINAKYVKDIPINEIDNMMEVILKIKMPDGWVKDISSRFGAKIKFLDCMPNEQHGCHGLIQIESKEDLNELLKEIEEHPNVCQIDVTSIGDRGIMGAVVTNKCVACRALTGSDCFLVSAMSGGDGSVDWKLITGREGSLKELVERLEKNGCEVELKSVTQLDKKKALTKRQEDIVKMAWEQGYYDHPKKTTIKELAKSFSISPSTLAEILQRGEKKIISRHFTDR